MGKRQPKQAKPTDVDTASIPTLAPSVEEAYRRKCIQLKQRTREVEEANDAARLRLNRLKRQVEKLRLERAFLLEQLAKRTSTNVEDSDGSPSPPPTVWPASSDFSKPLDGKEVHILPLPRVLMLQSC
jgi:non-histone protein 10